MTKPYFDSAETSWSPLAQLQPQLASAAQPQLASQATHTGTCLQTIFGQQIVLV
jgi:hypothetical protein